MLSRLMLSMNDITSCPGHIDKLCMEEIMNEDDMDEDVNLFVDMGRLRLMIRRAHKKMCKQQRPLIEVVVPPGVQQNLLSVEDIKNDIVVVDGGVVNNPPIRPPDGVNWRRLPVNDNTHLHIQDEFDPHLGLTLRDNGCSTFIRMPRQQSLDIFGKFSMEEIILALEECEKLTPTSLQRGDNKRVFGDYETPLKYTSAGVQVSRNSREVLNCNSYMEKLSEKFIFQRSSIMVVVSQISLDL